jgi:murein DD-endopeptidase MepM/ murein hydrolase activator NlpD
MIHLFSLFKKSPPISQEFGKNPDTYKPFGFDGHNGVDFAPDYGTEILAPADGKVARIKYDEKGYGHYIVINHIGAQTLYGHLSEVQVAVDQKVKKGDILGKAGNTGFVLPKPTDDNPEAGTHLHFGLRLLDEKNNILEYENGYWGYVDPLPYYAEYDTRPFSDVDDTHPYYDAIVWAKKMQVVSGYAHDGTLHPDEALTVGRFLAIMQKYHNRFHS